MANIFTNLLQRPDDQAMTEKSKAWFREQAQKIRSLDTQKLIVKSKENARSRVLVGQMYLFAYDPKHKDTLPYYDRFPLIFPFKKDNKGMYGINMHYLPPIMRAKLMDGLYDLVNNDNYDETTRLKLSYRILNSVTKFRYFKPCVKHYLNNQIDSRLIFIHPDEWEIALFLPLHRFIKARPSQVYKESRNIISGR